MIYETDEDFKEAIEKRLNLTFSNKAWGALKTIMGMTPIHIGVDDLDVDDVVRIWRKLKNIHED